MAFVFRSPENERAVYIRCDKAVSAPEDRRVMLICGTVAYQMADALGVSWPADNLIKISNEYFLFDSLILKHKTDTVYLAFLGKDGDGYSSSEPLVFHQSYFYQFYDFAKTSDIFQLPGHFLRHEPVAIFTQVYNENTMLKLWEKYYSKSIDPRHLYVLDHGSTIDPREIVSSKINVIKMPRGETDHRNLAHFCSQFQRFLLSHYRWVIHTDVDEIIIHKNGFTHFVQMLSDRNEAQIIKAADAYNIVHNPLVESDLDLEQPITLQRTHIVPDSSYRKPLIASVPNTWGLGFHFVLEKELLVEDDDLWLMHLPFMDLELIAAKNSKWNSITFSEACQIHIPHSKSSTESEDIATMLAAKLTTEGSTTMPDWVRGMF